MVIGFSFIAAVTVAVALWLAITQPRQSQTTPTTRQTTPETARPQRP